MQAFCLYKSGGLEGIDDVAEDVSDGGSHNRQITTRQSATEQNQRILYSPGFFFVANNMTFTSFPPEIFGGARYQEYRKTVTNSIPFAYNHLTAKSRFAFERPGVNFIDPTNNEQVFLRHGRTGG